MKKYNSNKGRIGLYLKASEYEQLKAEAEKAGQPLPTFAKGIIEAYLKERRENKPLVDDHKKAKPLVDDHKGNL